MTEELQRIEEIKARLEAATPGPWYAVEDDNGAILAIQTGTGGWVVDEVAFLGKESDEQAHADAEFLSLAPEDIAYLLDRVSRLEAVAQAAEAFYHDGSDLQGLWDGGKALRAALAALRTTKEGE